MAGTIARRRADNQGTQPGTAGSNVTLFTFSGGLGPEPGGMLNAVFIANLNAATRTFQGYLVESGGSVATGKEFIIQIAGKSVVRLPIGLYVNSASFLTGQVSDGVSGDLNTWFDVIEES